MLSGARDFSCMDAHKKRSSMSNQTNVSLSEKYERDEALWSYLVFDVSNALGGKVSVMELEDGGGAYTTSTCHYGGVDDEEDDLERKQKDQQSQKNRLSLQCSSTHIVKPALVGYCLCGIWQDTLLPCRHACALCS